MATQVATRKIDADTHFNLTVDYRDLRELLSRGQQAQASEMLWLDAQRIVDPETVRVDLTGSGVPNPGEGSGDPEWDPDARIRAALNAVVKSTVDAGCFEETIYIYIYIYIIK